MMLRCHPARRRGFTLIELLMTMTIIAVVAAVVLPKFTDGGRLHLAAASSVLTSDIQLAQVMTISNPADPVVVRLDPVQAKYWLARADTPDTPIPRGATGEPYAVVFGLGRAAAALGVTLSLSDLDSNTLAFDAQGAVADFTTEPAITLSLDTRWIRLEIAPTTGTITETSGSP